MGEGDQTPGCDQHLFACRRLPEDLTVERPGPHVEAPVVTQEVCIGEPEGLVVDEELDDFAVGHAENGLASFREAIRFFCVYDRPGFIESIDEGGVFGVGTAFLGAPAHAEVSVAEREHRFELRQELGVKWLGSWESARAFKGIICDDISEFESSHASHAVRSPSAKM